MSPGPGSDRLQKGGIWDNGRVDIEQRAGISDLGEWGHSVFSLHLFSGFLFTLQHLHHVVVRYVGYFVSEVAFNQFNHVGANAAFFGFAFLYLGFPDEAAVSAFPKAH